MSCRSRQHRLSVHVAAGFFQRDEHADSRRFTFQCPFEVTDITALDVAGFHLHQDSFGLAAGVVDKGDSHLPFDSIDQ